MAGITSDIYLTAEHQDLVNRRIIRNEMLEYAYGSDTQDPRIQAFLEQESEKVDALYQRYGEVPLYFIVEDDAITWYLPQNVRDEVPAYYDYLREGEPVSRAAISQYKGHAAYHTLNQENQLQTGVHVSEPRIYGGDLYGRQTGGFESGVYNLSLSFGLEGYSGAPYRTVGIVELSERRGIVAGFDEMVARANIDLPAFSYAGGYDPQFGDEEGRLMNCVVMSHRMLDKLGFKGLPTGLVNSFSMHHHYDNMLRDMAEDGNDRTISRREVPVDLREYVKRRYDYNTGEYVESGIPDDKAVAHATLRTVELRGGEYMTVINTDDIATQLSDLYKNHGVSSSFRFDDVVGILDQHGIGIENGVLVDHRISEVRSVETLAELGPEHTQTQEMLDEMEGPKNDVIR